MEIISGQMLRVRSPCHTHTSRPARTQLLTIYIGTNAKCSRTGVDVIVCGSSMDLITNFSLHFLVYEESEVCQLCWAFVGPQARDGRLPGDLRTMMGNHDWLFAMLMCFEKSWLASSDPIHCYGDWLTRIPEGHLAATWRNQEFVWVRGSGGARRRTLKMRFDILKNWCQMAIGGARAPNVSEVKNMG